MLILYCTHSFWYCYKCQFTAPKNTKTIKLRAKVFLSWAIAIRIDNNVITTTFSDLELPPLLGGPRRPAQHAASNTPPQLSSSRFLPTSAQHIIVYRPVSSLHLQTLITDYPYWFNNCHQVVSQFWVKLGQRVSSSSGTRIVTIFKHFSSENGGKIFEAVAFNQIYLLNITDHRY